MFDECDEQQKDDSSGKRYYGKYAGLVLENEITRDGSLRGELKIVVPGILEETPDEKGDRAIELIAAPSFLPGFFFIPEVGAQVWVEFLAGDINFPIWTGVWYPQKATPQSEAGKEPTRFQKVIRTPSGQVIQLDDTDGGEKLVLKDEKNQNTVTMDADGITLKRGDTSIVLKDDSLELSCGGHTVNLGSSGTTIDNKPVVLDPPTLINLIKNHVHPTTSPGSPTGPSPMLSGLTPPAHSSTP